MSDDRSITQPENIRRGVLVSGMSAIANIAFLMLETIIAARLLPTEAFGAYALLVTLVNVLVVAIDFGGKTALTQMIATGTPDRQSALVRSAVAFRLLVVVLAAALIWLIFGILAFFSIDPGLGIYLSYLPLMLAFTSLDEVLFGILQGFQAYRSIGIALVLRSALRLALTGLLLVVFDFGALALILSWVISFAASSLYQYLALPVRGIAFDTRLLAETVRFGLPLQATRFLWLVFRRVDVLLLAMFAGPAAVAFYTVAARIPEALQRVAESYITVYFPTMASLLKNGDTDQARMMLNRSLRLISFLAGGVALGGVVFRQEITVLLFSERYAASAPVFAVLMLGLHMALLVSLLGYTLTAAGYSGRSLALNLAQTGLNTGGDLLLIPALGFAGPAWAMLAAAYLVHPLAIQLMQHSGSQVEVRPYAIQTLLLLLCCGASWWFIPGIYYGAALIILFVALCFRLSAITSADLRLVVPERLIIRLGRLQESLSHGR